MNTQVKNPQVKFKTFHVAPLDFHFFVRGWVDDPYVDEKVDFCCADCKGMQAASGPSVDEGKYWCVACSCYTKWEPVRLKAEPQQKLKVVRG